MSNEAAFEKWAIDYGLDYEPSFTRYDVEAAWQAAIAYMQERDKLVEHCCPECGCHFVGEFPFKYKVKQNKYSEQSDKDNSLQKAFDLTRNTTPQRQQLMKRLTDEQINKCFEKVMFDEEAEPTRERIANAIMDAMQELNK